MSRPFENFRDPWAGSSFNGNAIATALVKTHYAFVGWANAFNVLSEVKGKNPVRTVHNAGRIALGLTTVVFVFINVAYISAIPRDEIKMAGQLVGAVFFKRVFGDSWAAKILPVMVVFSCVGNIVRIAIRIKSPNVYPTQFTDYTWYHRLRSCVFDRVQHLFQLTSSRLWAKLELSEKLLVKASYRIQRFSRLPNRLARHWDPLGLNTCSLSLSFLLFQPKMPTISS